MKLLRNPIVTGILCVAAVVVVYLQVVAPHVRLPWPAAAAPKAARAESPSRPPGRPAPIASSRVSTQQTSQATAEVVPGPSIDRRFVEVHFDGWVNWPRRDPFLIMAPDPPQARTKDTDVNSPVGSWRLKLILSQTGSRVAVIDHSGYRGVYREGDEVEGYKIMKIEGDEVWFQGPRRKERLGFDRVLPPHP